MDGVPGAPQVPSLLLSTSMASCYHIPPPPSMDSYPLPPLLPSRLLLSLWLEAFGRVLACATCIQHYLTLHGAYLGWDVRQARNALDRRKDRELLKFLSYAKLIGKSIQVPQDVASVHAALSIATPWSVIKVDYQYANVMGTFRPWLRSMSGDQLWRWRQRIPSSAATSNSSRRGSPAFSEPSENHQPTRINRYGLHEVMRLGAHEVPSSYILRYSSLCQISGHQS